MRFPSPDPAPPSRSELFSALTTASGALVTATLQVQWAQTEVDRITSLLRDLPSISADPVPLLSLWPSQSLFPPVVLSFPTVSFALAISCELISLAQINNLLVLLSTLVAISFTCVPPTVPSFTATNPTSLSFAQHDGFSIVLYPPGSRGIWWRFLNAPWSCHVWPCYLVSQCCFLDSPFKFARRFAYSGGDSGTLHQTTNRPLTRQSFQALFSAHPANSTEDGIDADLIAFTNLLQKPASPSVTLPAAIPKSTIKCAYKTPKDESYPISSLEYFTPAHIPAAIFTNENRSKLTQI